VPVAVRVRAEAARVEVVSFREETVQVVVRAVTARAEAARVRARTRCG
jgi:hypothetical protein